MLQCRALLVFAVLTVAVVAGAARTARAADAAAPAKAAEPAQAAEGATPEGDESSDLAAKAAAAPVYTPKGPRMLVPKRTDKCGLTGERAEAPFVATGTYAASAFDPKSKVATAILKNGSYVWTDLKECEQHFVVARVVSVGGPSSSDTKHWLKIVAQVAGMLKGPLLDDGVLALEKIANDGTWFPRKIRSGVALEFPMAKEYVRFYATVIDGDGMTILTLVQEAS